MQTKLIKIELILTGTWRKLVGAFIARAAVQLTE
jgi:hypothetical protein